MRVQANLAHGAPDQTDRAERWLADHLDEIAEAYDGPEDVVPEAQDTARGNRVCRVAVYRSGCVGQMAPVESAEWFVDLLVAEATPQYESEWAAIESVASKIGASAESVRKWVRRVEVDSGQRAGLTSQEHADVKRLRRANAEPRRANEILKAPAGGDNWSAQP